MRNKALLVTALTVALSAGGYGTAFADGSGHDHGKDVDRVSGTGAFPLGTFSFQARDTSTDPFGAAGYFQADGASVTSPFLHLQGKITCLDVRGNRAGFLYPVESGSTPPLLVGQVVMISLEDGGPGKPDHIGFIGPAPAAAFPNCAPGLTPLPVTSGDVVVHDGAHS